MDKLAPIALFVYNRPSETAKAIEALRINSLAKKSEIFIFSDAPKSKEEEEKVKQVRAIIHQIAGFKSVRITEAEENKGLANSIIQGVKELMSKYDKVIVMEDDLICSLDYLEYMNEALEVYQNNKLIWSISGYTPNLSFPKAFEEQVYLSSRGCSWGWATWKDRWKKVDWGVADFEDFKKDKERREAFNQGGNDLYKLLELHMLGKVDSWAIRWCYSQFKRNTYTVYPVKSKISNHGFNLNGTHNRGKDSRWDVELCSEKIQLPETVSIDKEVFNSFKNYYDLDWVGRSGYFSRKYGFYGFAQKFKRMFRK